MAKIQVEDVSPAGDWTFSGTVNLSGDTVLSGVSNFVFYDDDLIYCDDELIYYD